MRNTTSGRVEGSRQPIIFDDHTDHSKIELYYYVDTRVGKPTCMAKCEHCWLDREHSKDFAQDVEEAKRIIAALRAQNCRVSPMVSDTFAMDGHYLRAGLFRNNDDWAHGNGAWTSGRPLLRDNWEELLELAVGEGMSTIALTSHGTENKDVGLKGITQPDYVRQAVARIHDFNARHGNPFQITLTFTIGKSTASREKIDSYFEHCHELGANIMRLNQFADFQQRFPEERMDREDLERVYVTMKEAYAAQRGNVSLSVSEDFGRWGIEVMGFPAEVGRCIAGENFFGVIYPYIYACPVELTLVVGKIDESGAIAWNKEMLDRLIVSKQREDFSGCLAVSFAHNDDIRAELSGPPEKLVQLRSGGDLRSLGPIGADGPMSTDHVPVPTTVSRATGGRAEAARDDR